MADQPFYLDNLGNVVQEDADVASRLAYSPATPEQIKKHQNEEKYGGALGVAATAVTSAAGDATLGLTDQALTKSGLVKPETLRTLREVNPVAREVGELAGILGSLAIPGEGELNLVKGIGRLGLGAEKLAAGALEREGAGLLGRAAAKAGAKAAGGALEGVAYSAGHEISEDALGDPNQTAQSVLAHLGLGALLGGSLGATFGAGEELLPAAVTKARDSLASTATSLKKAGLDAYIPWAAKATGAPEDMVREIVENRGAGAPLDVADTARNLANGLQDASETANALHRRLYSEVVPEEEKDFLNASGMDMQVKPAYGRVFDAMDGALQKMRAEPELYNPGFARKLEQLQEGMVRDLSDTSMAALKRGETAANNPLKVFRKFKELRSGLDEDIKWGKSALDLGLQDKNANNLFKELRSTIRGELTDSQVFGPIAARKAALDGAQSDFISAQKEFNRFFTRPSGAGRQVDQEKLVTYLGKLAKDKADSRSEVLDTYLKAHDALIKEAEESARNAPTAKFDTKALSSLVEKQGDAVQAARQAVAKAEALKQFGGQPGGIGTGEAAAIGMAAHAHPVLAGAWTAVKGASAALKFAKDVPRAAATLGAVEKMSQRVAKAIDAGAKALVTGAKSSEQAVEAGALSTFSGDFSEGTPSENVFAERAQHINQLANNPEYLLQKLGDMGALGQHAPKTATALQTARMRAIQHLASRLPPMPKLGLIGPQLKPSRGQMAPFNRALEALHDPTSLLRKAAKGTLTPDARDAVQAVMPEHFAQQQQAVLKALGATNAKLMPRSARLGAYMILGHDIDGTMTPQAIQANQAIFRLPSAKSPDNQTGPAATGRSTQTGLGRLKTADRAMLPGRAAESHMGER